ncbi:uncharacterized protein H6S33_012421 [Morchella sextelata]|uniref:uncharacterized protein n=1 Tax=Morchella sextelata TaxID=1174677 RepID=UPI001D0438FB|nr:uncharacterized protein H6S33_012421 [Morchella sextelata]KAH0609875.1 hypothetical protein H6S33_012421 [Morchella sextelata]
MEGPQRRRRPAATYGKSTKKRYADVVCGDIFTSTDSPKELEELSGEEQQQQQQRNNSKGVPTITTTKTVKAQKNQQIITDPSSNLIGGASLLLKDGQKKVQATLKGKNKRPIANSAVTSPPKHHKVFDFTPSDDDDNIPQPQIEDTWRHNGIDEFDVPSSGDEESFAVRKKPLPNQLPRAPNTSINTSIRRFAKETKKGRDGLPSQDSKLVRKDSTSRRGENQAANSKDGGRDTAKIKKLPPTKPPTEVPKAVSKLDEISKAPKPAKRHYISSLSLEPDVMTEHLSEQTVRHARTKSTQTKPKINLSNGPAKPVTLPVISDETQLSPLLSQQNRRDSVPYSPGIVAHVDGLSNRNPKPEGESKGAKRVPRFSEIFQSGGDELPAPQRRRLIDRLGAGKPDYPMMSSSESESSDEGLDEYTYHTQQSTSQPRNPFESQPEVDIAMEESQFTIEPTAKPVYNNSGPKVTYARQRSFRTEEFDENTMFNVPLVMSQQSFGSKRNDGMGEDEDLEGETGSKMMKTIHELREAGVNNRFLDDIEELFGDIEGDSPLSRRRSGYLELAGKMREKSFISKFRANNFTERLFTKLNKQTDEIVCFILSYILCCLLLEDSTVQIASQARKNGSIPMLVRMLDFEKDIYIIAKDRKTNMSKATQSMVQDLRTQVEKSPIFSNRRPKILSPQIIALKVLEQSVRKLREAGVDDDILSAGGLGKLVHILNPFAITNFKGVEKARDTFVLELAVSTLESHAVGNRVPAEQQFSPSELKIVAALIPAVIKMETSDVNDILLLILRFTINLTNNRASICNTFAESSLISVLVGMVCTKFDDLADLSLEMNERLVKLDLLILSLGLLINFAELSDRARCAVDDRGAPEDEKTLLDELLHIYLERQERAAEADSEEESQSNVAFGYLSILLGNLCQNSNIQEKIRLRMPNATLQPLFNSLEEFIAHHRKVDDQYENYDDGPNAAFTERLEQMVRRLRKG